MEEVKERGADVPTVHCATTKELEDVTGGYSIPVKLVGVLEDWPPLRSWTPGMLARGGGERRLRLCKNDLYGRWYENVRGRAGTEYAERTLREFLALLEQGNPDRYYAGEVSVRDELPALAQDVENTSLMGLLPTPPELVRLWLGCDNPTALHYDLFHTCIAVAWGRKEVLLYPPSELEAYYPCRQPGMLTSSQVRNPLRYGANEFPEFPAAQGQRAIVNPGEVLFIPLFHWHYIQGGNDVNLSFSFHWHERSRRAYGSPYFRHALPDYFLGACGAS